MRLQIYYYLKVVYYILPMLLEHGYIGWCQTQYGVFNEATSRGQIKRHASANVSVFKGCILPDPGLWG